MLRYQIVGWLNLILLANMYFGFVGKTLKKGGYVTDNQLGNELYK